ncbi:hypothetical protein ACRN9O_17740 [Shewanella oncorhynchi]|uniref:hypothetical protein n=1 Tax=Shewanella TaxID=22 RepID=UPI0021DB4E79|nr:hypothetical protein [Shewanella sp. SM87]MCU8006143.1 hypothetical protein [Shewanella sp. SM87]
MSMIFCAVFTPEWKNAYELEQEHCNEYLFFATASALAGNIAVDQQWILAK